MTARGDDPRRRLRRYRRRERTAVVAVRLDLDTEGFTYEKWGGTQRCKRGDWIVTRDDDTYTVDADAFERTYRQLTPGVYEKIAPVYAAEADEPGSIRTTEGFTSYDRGDFLVFNDREGNDGYAITAERFHSLYEPEE